MQISLSPVCRTLRAGMILDTQRSMATETLEKCEEPDDRQDLAPLIN